MCIFSDDGISIPVNYTSFLAPLSSPKLWTETRNCKDQSKPADVRISVVAQGPYGALKVLKSLEFDWTKFKALKSLNFTKLS